MKKQDESFKLKRDKVRSFMKMTRLDITKQTYMKLMGQVVNGKKDDYLQELEIERLDSALGDVLDAVKDLKDELSDSLKEIRLSRSRVKELKDELHS